MVCAATRRDGADLASKAFHEFSMAGEKSIVSGMAGRYATALFELALEERAVDAVKADLDRFDAMIAENPDLTRLVRSPVADATTAAINSSVCRLPFIKACTSPARAMATALSADSWLCSVGTMR